MNYAVVTSCSAKGWETYGERFVRTFLEFWPKVELILCSEDALPEIAGVTVLNLRETAGGYIERHANNKVTHGKERAPGQKPWKATNINAGYNFRYDAARFGLKAFAIDMAAQKRGGGRLLWVDADVVTFAPVPLSLLDETLPRTFALSCLDRGMDYHSDCSWVGYNLDHPQTLPFIAAFRRLYETDAVLKLQEWHDSWVFDYLRRSQRMPTHCIPHLSRSHPLPNSAIGQYCDHLKGARKQLGKTPRSEIVSASVHPYWTRAA
jgi:hypothetical protein